MYASELTGLVPFERLADVAAFLADAVAGAPIEVAERLTGGASGAGVFKLTAGSRAYLLRLDGEPDGFRDCARQYACHRIAAEAGVASTLVRADPAERISLSAFVVADPAEDRAVRLTQLATALRRLHDAPLFPTLMPFFDAMDRLLDGFAASGVLPASCLAEPLALYGRLAQACRRDPEPQVSSHNDLNPNNVLFEAGRAVFVDWESAFAADRYVDLAAALNFFTVGEGEAALVLETYLGRKPNSAERARAFLMRQVSRLFYAAMLIGVAGREHPGLALDEKDLAVSLADLRAAPLALHTWDGKARYGATLLGEAHRTLRSQAFERALAEL